MLCTLCFLVLPLLAGLSLYFVWTRKYRYWENRNVPCVPASFPFGNFYSAYTMKEPIFEVVGKAYDDFENADLIGMYGPIEPCLLIRTAELAKGVLIDKFNDFMDNGFEVPKSVDPALGHNPFSLQGQEWKEVRSIHTPVFTASKIKMMTSEITSCARRLKTHLEKNENNVLNVIPLTKMFLIDAVSVCAYGVEPDVWTNPEPLLRSLIDQGLLSGEFEGNVSAANATLMPWANYIFRTKLISSKALVFMRKIYQSAVLPRRDNSKTRNDLIQHLLETDDRLKAAGKPGFTNLTWTTNLFVFFLDGTETASIAMSYAIYCIAKHQDVQEKIKDEIQRMGVTLDSLDFDKLKSLEYLEMVFQETMRLYPPLPVLSRKTTRETTLGNVRVPVGMKVVVPAWKLQKDSKNFPNPEEFDPERFSAERKSSVPKGAYLPFGEGPRLCVGLRFAKTAIKIGLVTILLSFDLSLGPSHKGDIKFHPKSTFFLFPENGLAEVKFSPVLK